MVRLSVPWPAAGVRRAAPSAIPASEIAGGEPAARRLARTGASHSGPRCAVRYSREIDRSGEARLDAALPARSGQ